MIRSYLYGTAALASLAFAAPAAHAQGAPVESNHIVSVGLGGGVSVPVSDAKNAFKQGFNGQGFVRLNLGFLPISPRIDFTFQRFDLKSAGVSPTGPSAFSGGTGKVLAGVANLQFPLLRGPIEPYLVAGVGAYSVKTELDASGSTPSSESSKTQFGVNGGAGLIVKLGIVSLYAEGRVDNVYTDKGVIDKKSIQVVPVTFGIVY